MNVLIFTGRFGQGHLSAAHALRQEVLRQDPTAAVTIVDIVEDCFPQLRRLVYHFFDFTVNHCSGVYNFLNKMAGRGNYPPITPLKSAMIQKLDQLLTFSQADLLLSTLPLSSQYLSAYKELTGSTLPLYTYITDIQAHHEWIAPHTDCYFVGDESTRLQLLRAGVPGDRIVVSGIPVREGFSAARMREPSPRRNLLVMGGGLGLIPQSDRLLGKLAQAEDIQVTVITGNNETLRASLEETYPSFTVVGYTDRVEDYMAKADLLLTKAGGSTLFEAMHAGLPLCLLHPFLMQERGNAAYARDRGFGIVLSPDEDPGQAILSLLRDPETLSDMCQRMAVTLRSLDHTTALTHYHSREAAAC